MSDQGNLDTVKQAYAAFARGDVPVLLALLDPAVEWEVPGPPEIPWAGRYRGPQEVRRFVEAVAAACETEAFEPRSFVVQGSAVVVLGSERMRARSTGRPFETHWAHAFTVEGGRLARFREYTDTHAIAAAFRRP